MNVVLDHPPSTTSGGVSAAGESGGVGRHLLVLVDQVIGEASAGGLGGGEALGGGPGDGEALAV